MVEAMVALTLVDALMMQQAQCQLFPNDSDAINPMGSAVKGRRPLHAVAFADAAAANQRIDEE